MLLAADYAPMDGLSNKFKSFFAYCQAIRSDPVPAPLALGWSVMAFSGGVLWALYDPLASQGFSLVEALRLHGAEDLIRPFAGGLLRWVLFLSVLLTLVFGLLVCLGRSARVGLLMLLGLLGVVWSASTALQLRADWLAPEWQGKNLLITAQVIQLPGKRGDGSPSRFAVQVLDARLASGKKLRFQGRVRLSWKRGPDLKLGQVWRMTVRLKRPHGLANPHTFDYEAWLFSQRYRATGYVRDRDSTPLELTSGQAFDHAIDKAIDKAINKAIGLDRRIALWRQSLIESVPELPFQGVLRALLVGDRSGLSQDQWTVFRRTGTGHLVAISGLHIGLMAAMAYFLVRWLARWQPLSRWLERRAWTRQQFAALVAFVMAGVYAVMAGFGVPTQRALIMLGIGLGAILLRFPLRSWRVWLLALLLVLLVDPLAPLAPGFWLSFAAVAWIILAYGGRRPVAGVTAGWKWVRIHWVLALGLAPLTLFWFSQASMIAPLANLIAVPLVSLAVVPLTLLGGLLALVWPDAGQMVLAWADGLLEWLWLVLQWMAEWELSSGEVPALEGRNLGFLLLAMLLLILPRGLPGRGLALVLMLPLALWNLRGDATLPDLTLREGAFRLTVLDVGQGLSAVVRTRNRVLLYDTGPAYPSGFNTGEAVVVPWLKGQGHRHLDTLIVSHGDSDHRGGLEAVQEAVSIGRLISGEPGRVPGAAPCVAGLTWQWDGVHFATLAPPKPSDSQSGWRGNNASCVLRVDNDRRSVLLTADLEARGEEYLLEQPGLVLRSDVLQVPHHGSRSSSTPAFVRAVSPQIALFTSGYRNRFGLPKEDIEQRYQDVGAALFNTREKGAMELRFGADGRIHGPKAWRETHRRIWR